MIRGKEDPSAERASTWLAGALVLLPLLQALPVDFDRTAPLLVLPALWFGRRELGSAVAGLLDAALWLQAAGAVAFLAAGLAVLRAAHPAPALVTAATWIVMGAAALLAGSRVRSNPGAGYQLLAGIALGAAIGTATVWLLWVLGGRGAMPLYAHHRHLGLHTIAGAVCTTGLILRPGGGRAARLGWFGAGAIVWGGLLWSGGRAPLLAVAGSLAVCFLLLRGRRRWHLTGWATAQLAAGLALSAVFWTTRPELGWWHAFHRTVAAAEARNVTQLTSTRDQFWKTAARRAMESPWVGRGPDAYRFIVPKLDGQQPHNVALQLWLDVGVLGAIPALVLLAGGLVAGWKAVRDSVDPEPDATWPALLTALTAAGMLDGVFYHTLTCLPALLALGVILRKHTGASPSASRLLVRTIPAATVGTAAAVLALHAMIFHRLAVAPVPAEPAGFVPRLVRGFPSTTFGLWRWLDEWHRTSPELALAWARWAQDHATNPALFHIRAAQYLQVRGDRAGAEAELRTAFAKVHWTAQPQVAAMLRDLGAKP